MAKTLLNGVNEILKKAESIDSGGAFTSLTDSSRQVWIDTAVQAFNETVDELYDLSGTPQRPNQVSSSNITLASTQVYALASDVARLLPRFGLIDSTNNRIIAIDASPDAYRKLIVQDLDQNDTGLPSIAAIRPTDGKLWLDRAPTSDYNGDVYTYRYEKDLGLSAYDDTVPFGDAVFRAVAEAATERYLKINHREYDARIYLRALSRGASRLSMLPRRTSWGGGVGMNPTDPMEA